MSPVWRCTLIDLPVGLGGAIGAGLAVWKLRATSNSAARSSAVMVGMVAY
jgi:hypothetical protein